MWGWWRLYERLRRGQERDEVGGSRATSTASRSRTSSRRSTCASRTATFETNSLSENSCRSFYRPTDSHARGISSIISFDLLGDQLRLDADHVVSNWATFYSSKDTLLLAEPAHDWWWYWWFDNDPDQLNIHAFDISAPGETRYTGSGRVEGQIVDQFSLDEDNGAIRAATTTGFLSRWWLDDDERSRDREPRLGARGPRAATSRSSVTSAASRRASASCRRASRATRATS